MNAVIVIPARLGSTRLPAKPLLRETGKFLIQHVHEQALKCKHATRVIVATDDERIAEAVRSFGGESVMTLSTHRSGTDRIAEVIEKLDCTIVVNIQGDEPRIDPDAVDRLMEMLRNDATTDVATLATPIRDAATFENRSCVKVVCDDSQRALYFSRSPIPHHRDHEPDWQAAVPPAWLHLGVYAYRREALQRMANTPPHPLELTEQLEQLRLLAMGGTIRVATVPHAHPGIDTPEDYAQFVEMFRRDATSRDR